MTEKKIESAKTLRSAGLSPTEVATSQGLFRATL